MGEFTSSGSGEPKGAIMWISPEIMWPEQFNVKDRRPTKESGVYSLGILIYEHLRQRTNISFVGIDLFRNRTNWPRRMSLNKGSAYPNSRLGSQILFGKLCKPGV
ncbi:hypothetical protein BDM02DRAFT_3133060 [Thelephora ganbajun]|uniref:Uncharacterized protein n=1 Tax=Thelephora ganbajun TaxID=370292 RepID=A0ACB6YYK2_THEGA|nr:hypothetical protein BDM02DRAFT_3133060 [Thelephora ganbajun]